MRHIICEICGKTFCGAGQARTCSGACRQTKARRKRDAERTALDIGNKLERLLQGYQAGAIDHDLMRAIINHIDIRFETLRAPVDAEQLRRLLEKTN